MLIAIGVFTLGLLVGMIIEAFRDRADDSEPVSLSADAQDAVLMNYLERAECSLFFNPTLSAWGLLDGQDKMVATAHSVRATLSRAMVSDKAGA